MREFMVSGPHVPIFNDGTAWMLVTEIKRGEEEGTPQTHGICQIRFHGYYGPDDPDYEDRVKRAQQQATEIVNALQEVDQARTAKTDNPKPLGELGVFCGDGI